MRGRPPLCNTYTTSAFTNQQTDPTRSTLFRPHSNATPLSAVLVVVLVAVAVSTPPSQRLRFCTAWSPARQITLSVERQRAFRFPFGIRSLRSTPSGINVARLAGLPARWHASVVCKEEKRMCCCLAGAVCGCSCSIVHVCTAGAYKCGWV